MPRILGVDLPKDKRIDVSLTYLYGVGKVLALKILAEVGISPSKRAKEVTDEEISRITNLLQKSYRVEGDLRRDISQNIKRLVDIGSWRGMRHKKGLPVRGQRTRTNARTRKGPRRGGAMVKKDVAAPKRVAPKPAGK